MQNLDKRRAGSLGDNHKKNFLDLKLMGVNQNTEAFMQASNTAKTAYSTSHRATLGVHTNHLFEQPSGTHTGLTSAKKAKDSKKNISDKSQKRYSNGSGETFHPDTPAADALRQNVQIPSGGGRVMSKDSRLKESPVSKEIHYKHTFMNNMGFNEKPQSAKNYSGKKELRFPHTTSNTPTTSLYQAQPLKSAANEPEYRTTFHGSQKRNDYQPRLVYSNLNQKKNTHHDDKKFALEYYQDGSEPADGLKNGQHYSQVIKKKDFSRAGSHPLISSYQHKTTASSVSKQAHENMNYYDDYTEELNKNATSQSTKASYSPNADLLRSHSGAGVMAAAKNLTATAQEFQERGKQHQRRSASTASIKDEQRTELDLLMGELQGRGESTQLIRKVVADAAALESQVRGEQVPQLETLKALYQQKRRENLQHLKSKNNATKDSPSSNFFSLKASQSNDQLSVKHFDEGATNSKFSTNSQCFFSTPSNKGKRSRQFVSLNGVHHVEKNQQGIILPDTALKSDSLRGLNPLSTRSAAGSSHRSRERPLNSSSKGSSDKMMKQSSSERYGLLNGLINNEVMDQIKANPNAKFLTLRKQVKEKRQSTHHESLSHTRKSSVKTDEEGLKGRQYDPSAANSAAISKKQPESNLRVVFEKTKTVLTAYRHKEKKWHQEKELLLGEILSLRSQLHQTAGNDSD